MRGRGWVSGQSSETPRALICLAELARCLSLCVLGVTCVPCSAPSLSLRRSSTPGGTWPLFPWETRGSLGENAPLSPFCWVGAGTSLGSPSAALHTHLTLGHFVPARQAQGAPCRLDRRRDGSFASHGEVEAAGSYLGLRALHPAGTASSHSRGASCILPEGYRESG